MLGTQASSLLLDMEFCNLKDLSSLRRTQLAVMNKERSE